MKQNRPSLAERNDLLADLEIPRTLWCVLHTMAEFGHICTASVATLARFSRCSVRTVQYSTRKLEGLGLIDVEPGGGRCNTHRVSVDWGRIRSLGKLGLPWKGCKPRKRTLNPVNNVPLSPSPSAVCATACPDDLAALATAERVEQGMRFQADRGVRVRSARSWWSRWILEPSGGRRPVWLTETGRKLRTILDIRGGVIDARMGRMA